MKQLESIFKPIAIIIAIVVGFKLLSFVSDPFGKGMNKNEQETHDELENVPVNTSNLSITSVSALQRANAIADDLNSVVSFGTSIYNNLSRGWTPDTFTFDDIMTQWHAADGHYKLSKDDIRLIVKKFGVRQFGWIDVDNMTLREAVDYYDYHGEVSTWVHALLDWAGV